MQPYRFSLTFAILASLTCLLLLTWFLVSLISFKTAENDLIAQKNEEGRLLLASFIRLLPDRMAGGGDMTPARQFADGLAMERSFAGLLLVDGEGRGIYFSKNERPADARLLRTLATGKDAHAFSENSQYVYRYAPVVARGKVVGAARLTQSLQNEYTMLKKSRRIFLAYFVLDFLLLLGLGSYVLARFIVVPMRKLLAATERITAGDLSHKVHIAGGAEIADLAGAFNTMVATLAEKHEDVQRYVKSLEAINRELKAARQETIRSEKMASIGLLAAGTAHEIGTPLAAIMGYTGLLRDEIQGEAVKTDYLDRIEAESERIDRIVRGLLDYARQAPVECEEVDVGVVLSKTVDMLTTQGLFKKIELSLSAAENIPAVYLDRQQLQQVFINLLINARDAMPCGGTLNIRADVMEYSLDSGCSPASPMQPAIGRRRDDFGNAFSSSFQQGARMVRIEVGDTGEGITAENMQKIFDPFFTTKEPGQGTGLGLSISARIIDSFGGRITVESMVGKGSLFTVWLPVRPDSASC